MHHMKTVSGHAGFFFKFYSIEQMVYCIYNPYTQRKNNPVKSWQFYIQNFYGENRTCYTPYGNVYTQVLQYFIYTTQNDADSFRLLMGDF